MSFEMLVLKSKVNRLTFYISKRGSIRYKNPIDINRTYFYYKPLFIYIILYIKTAPASRNSSLLPIFLKTIYVVFNMAHIT